jgi:hypothetical protein
MPTSSSRRVVALASAGLVAVTIVFTLSAQLYQRLEARSIRPVNGAIPSKFPVVVLYPQPDATRVARALYFSEVPWGRVGRDLFVSIPPEDVTAINASLCEQTRSRQCNDPHDPLAFTATVAVASASDHSQVVRSELNWERDRKNVGWYEVSNNTVRPLRYQDFAWVRALQVAWMLAALIAAGTAAGGLYVTRKWWQPSSVTSGAAT